MKQIPLSGKYGTGKFTIFDDENYELFLKHKWHVNRCGYLTANIGRFSLLFHREVLKAKNGQYVDHVNWDKLDNRKINLRICDNSQNLANRGPQKNNKSGYKGVSWSKLRKKWVAHISINGKRTNLGGFSDIVEAAKMYDNNAVRTFGEFAKTNFPVT